jgi:hypothetical protein
LFDELGFRQPRELFGEFWVALETLRFCSIVFLTPPTVVTVVFSSMIVMTAFV